MAHKSKKNEGADDFELVPQGTHIAVCCLVAYVGFHSNEFKGKKKTLPQMVFMWELVNEKQKNGQPFKVAAFYTDSLHEKANMRKMLACWRGRDFTEEEERGFEINAVLGKPCMVSVIHKQNAQGDTKARVNAVAKLPKGTTVPAMVSPPLYYSVEKNDPDSCDILMLPEWIRKKIAEQVPNPESGTTGNEPPPDHTNEGDEDLPF